MGLIRAAARSFQSPATTLFTTTLSFHTTAAEVLTQGYEHESGGDPEGQRVTLLLLVDSTLLGCKDRNKENDTLS